MRDVRGRSDEEVPRLCIKELMWTLKYIQEWLYDTLGKHKKIQKRA